MYPKTTLLSSFLVSAVSGCVVPGICVPPNTEYSRVISGPTPGQQWNIEGGFCGAFSVQHAALAFGAWISQDLVRKSNRNQPGPHHMHGDTTVGFEVMPSNVAYTANALRLTYLEWDSSQAPPQAPTYKRWLKKNLAAGHPVVWFPICKVRALHATPKRVNSALISSLCTSLLYSPLVSGRPTPMLPRQLPQWWCL